MVGKISGGGWAIIFCMVAQFVIMRMGVIFYKGTMECVEVRWSAIAKESELTCGAKIR